MRAARKILLVKTSSMGDVVHAFPAVSEAISNLPGLRIDWVVEEAFADLPALHPDIHKVIPVAIRRWRKNLIGSRSEISTFRAALAEEDYDLVVDSQGLIKSALVSWLAKGQRHGFSRSVAREKPASWFYQFTHEIPTGVHAVFRQKQLLASALGYEMSDKIEWGLHQDNSLREGVVLVHGTSWPSKEWPESYWRSLARLASDAGHSVLIPAGTEQERQRARRILDQCAGEVLYGVSLKKIAERMAKSLGVVSVDTGLGHLAAALNLPSVSLFGPTRPGLTGIVGADNEVLVSNHLPCIPCMKRDCRYQKTSESSSIYPPCFEHTTPERVWQALQQQIGSKGISPA